MVDIAASLSLTPSSKAFDPAAVAGVEVPDIHAFGDILAGQITVTTDGSTLLAPLPLLSVPLPALSIPAGKRQADGKILPVAAPLLPEAEVAEPENAGQPVLPDPAVTSAETAAARVLTVRVPLKAIENSKVLEPVPAVAAEEQALPPAQAPIKVAAQVARAIKAAASGQSDPDQQEPLQAEIEGAVAQQIVADPATIQTELLGMQFFAGHLESQPPGTAAPATRSASSAPASPSVPSTRLAEPAVGNQAQSQPAESAAKSPVLTVVAAAQTQVTAIMLGQAAVRPSGHAATARIKVALPEAATVQTLPAAPASLLTPASVVLQAAEMAVRVVPAALVAQTVAADHAYAAERMATDLSVPMIADIQAPAASAPAPAVTVAPAVEMPRYDFAALVDRLIEARNTSAPHSVGASVNHAEFGQVSLQFHQEGKDLSVSMSSADPEFTVAVQAAMPAERPAASGDGQQRGQGHTPAHSQSQSHTQTASQHQEAAGQRSAEMGQQGRDGQQSQGRNSRGGTNTSNPSGTWSDRDQPQSRGGIFA